MKRTARGFEYIEFKQFNYPEPCSLQQSSIAVYQQPGAGAIWLGIDVGPDDKRRMHLHRNQVKRLIVSLQRWVDTGSFMLSSFVESK